MSLTSLNRLSKNVRIETIVIPELEFSNIERHVFAGNVPTTPRLKIDQKPGWFGYGSPQ
jgi:hypothetical protein